METVTVDDLPVRRTPGTLLQVIHDPPTLGEAGEPSAQRGGVGRTKQGQHQALAAKWRLVAGHVGGEECDRAVDEVAVGNGIRRAVSPVELLEGVELYGATEDVAIEAQGSAGGSRELKVGRRCGHGSDAMAQMLGAVTTKSRTRTLLVSESAN
jgi:hypothetical protein